MKATAEMLTAAGGAWLASREGQELRIACEDFEPARVVELFVGDGRIEFRESLDAVFVRQESAKANAFEVNENWPHWLIGINVDVGSLEISVRNSVPMKIDRQPQEGFGLVRTRRCFVDRSSWALVL